MLYGAIFLIGVGVQLLDRPSTPKPQVDDSLPAVTQPLPTKKIRPNMPAGKRVVYYPKN